MTPEQHKLVINNQNLVYHIFNKNIYLNDQTISWKDDIIQAGYLGLCKAAITFNNITSFSTYASRCIENEMIMLLRSIRNDFMVDSIYTPIDEDENTFLDVLSLDIDIEEEIEYNQKINFIKELLKSADERTQKIIQCKLKDINWKTLPEFTNTKKQTIDRLYHKFIDKAKTILEFIENNPDHGFSLKELYKKKINFFNKK